jgi:hypothetical protein
MRAATALLVLLVGLLAGGAAAAAPTASARPQTTAWARLQANTRLAVDLHDYFGLTLRFVSARTGAVCAGTGTGTTVDGVRRWRTFRCLTRLRGAEGAEFPGVVRVTLTLHVPVEAGAGPVASSVRVLSCTGKACPVR